MAYMAYYGLSIGPDSLIECMGGLSNVHHEYTVPIYQRWYLVSTVFRLTPTVGILTVELIDGGKAKAKGSMYIKF